MSRDGLVSIVTPTIPARMHLLLDRCIPSVARLEWPGGVEHVIVSDRNPDLRARHAAGELGGHVRLVEINDLWRTPVTEASVGAVPWQVGCMVAFGAWIGFLGDDDELLPDHARRHIHAMLTQQADFSISPVEFRVHGRPWTVIGDATFAHGHLDADGIMCRAETLRTATWTANGQDAADYRLVAAWLAAGRRGAFTGGPPTAIHHDGWAARMHP